MLLYAIWYARQSIYQYRAVLTPLSTVLVAMFVCKQNDNFISSTRGFPQRDVVGTWELPSSTGQAVISVVFLFLNKATRIQFGLIG